MNDIENIKIFLLIGIFKAYYYIMDYSIPIPIKIFKIYIYILYNI